MTLVDQIIDLLEEQEALGIKIAELSPESIDFLRGHHAAPGAAPRAGRAAPVEAGPSMADRYTDTPPPRRRQEATPPPPRPPATPFQSASPRPAEPAERPTPAVPSERPATPSTGYQPAHLRTPAAPAESAQIASPPADLSALDLSGVAEVIAGCTRCPLCEGRTNTVPGEGNPAARLMFIGEGPGQDEDRQGRPFVGAAGGKLDDIIHAMQFQREDVFIANIVKCRPPRNRKPEDHEATACLPYLERQIALVKPEVIVTLGATPLQYLLGVTGIMRHRGTWLDYRGIPVMPTFHPSYVLRLPEARREVWEDMKKVMARFGKDPDRSQKRNRP